MSTLPLTGTLAVVTGASRGIGAATAVRLHGLGSHVVLVGRDADALGRVEASLGSCCSSLVADLSAPGAGAAVIDQVVQHRGGVDILVNNAGVSVLEPVEDGDPAAWRTMLETNLGAAMECTHAALPHLLLAATTGSRRVADVVAISSVAARRPRKYAAAYSATKAGVNAFFEALRQEVSGRSVRISTIEAGAVDTTLNRHTRPAVLQELKRDAGPWEPLRPADVADAVATAVTAPRHASYSQTLLRPTGDARP
ncbi:MAG TPA: SDR family NAD(P)-dependent oxidoreductase [Acidimicrobiales bacterium]|nr:SDR family NAD(P)-dependent oxidoreductase [Acidimicrobiales bacterium]